MSEVLEAQRAATAASLRLQALVTASPAPSDENIALAQDNLTQLTQALQRIGDDLQRGAQMTLSSDGVSVMAGIQQFIVETRQQAAAHRRFSTAQGQEVLAPIDLSEACAFGFEAYALEATVPDSVEVIPRLDQQRQILSHIVAQLMAANPLRIDAVEREWLEGTTAKNGSLEGYRIDPAVSARVPGVIGTTAFRITFSGYSRSLREFLNALAEFQLPIVVRSMEVRRPDKPAVDVKDERSHSFDALLGAFSTMNPALSTAPRETQKPIVSENISRFTLELEFIEILGALKTRIQKRILPDEFDG